MIGLRLIRTGLLRQTKWSRGERDTPLGYLFEGAGTIGLLPFLEKQGLEGFHAVLELGKSSQEGHLLAIIFCRHGGGSHVHCAFLGR